jgi:hypothetical protein
MSGSDPKVDYLLVSFLGNENTTSFGKRVILDEPVDYSMRMQILWYKFTGLADTGGIPNEPVLYLDMQAGGESYADIKINKTTSKPPKWIPLPVDRSPQSQTMHFEQPFYVSFRNSGDRKMEYFYAKVYNEAGANATFDRCWVMLKLVYGSRLPHSAHVL